MTRKELITYCIDDQIRRGVISPESRSRQIKARLVGNRLFMAMSKAECERWYRSVKEGENKDARD